MFGKKTQDENATTGNKNTFFWMYIMKWNLYFYFPVSWSTITASFLLNSWMHMYVYVNTHK
jgi:hypothetical protein